MTDTNPYRTLFNDRRSPTEVGKYGGGGRYSYYSGEQPVEQEEEAPSQYEQGTGSGRKN